MNRSILLISYYFPPLGMAGPQRPLGLAKYLFRLGWKVYILTVKPIAYWETDPALLEEFPKEIPIFRAGSLDPARMAYLLGRRKREVSGSRPAALKMIWDSKLGFVPFAYCKAAALIEKFNIDTVWTTSPPPSLHLVGYGLKKWKKIFWVADFRDPWEVGAPEEDSLLWQSRKKKVQRLLSAADRVTVIDDSLKTFVKTISGEEKLATIFNGFDPLNRISTAGVAQNTFTMAYGGTLNAVSDPYPFLKALARWKKEKKRAFRLILVGKIIGLPVAQWLAELDLSENVEITGYLSHQTALRRLSEAHLLLLFLSPEKEYRLTLTAKIFEYIGLGKPLLATAAPRGAVADFLSRYPVGVLCSREEEMVEELERYHRQWQAQAILPVPEKLRRQFGWDRQAERLSDLILGKLK